MSPAGAFIATSFLDDRVDQLAGLKPKSPRRETAEGILAPNVQGLYEWGRLKRCYTVRAFHSLITSCIERAVFAAKVRAARAVLGLSQDQFALKIGLTQKSVHRIEHGDVQPKVRTILMIEQFWGRQGIAFENVNGGFRLVVKSSVLLHN